MLSDGGPESTVWLPTDQRARLVQGDRPTWTEALPYVFAAGGSWGQLARAQWST